MPTARRFRDIAAGFAPLAAAKVPFWLLFPAGLVAELPALLRRRRGQTTVEYLLMLAIVAGITLIMGVLFHKKLLGGMFTMVGLVIGAGRKH